MLLSQSLGSAYAVSWLRCLLGSRLAGTPVALHADVGVGVAQELILEFLAYRSRLAVRYRAVDRRIRKFSRRGSRFAVQLAFAPPRARLGQLFRVLRLLRVGGEPTEVGPGAWSLPCRLLPL